MLTALMSDIHGNREAFEACLADARTRAVERYVFLGDYVGYGADPDFVVDTVARFVEDGAVALLGNHDAAVFGTGDDMNAFAAQAIDWTRTRLDAAQIEFLRRLPLTAEEDDRLLVHANGWAPEGWGYITGPVEAERSMRRTAARLTFCGHVHVPAVYWMTPRSPAVPFAPVAGVRIPLLASRRWLAVVGAVGQPRDGEPAACYALLHERDGTLTYVRVPYDVDAAARKIIAAGLPERLAARLYRGA